MVKWEYRARIFWVEKDDELSKEYIKNTYPEWEWKEIPKYDPVALEAYLNDWGEGGWELVSMELGDVIGKNGDLGIAYSELYKFRQACHCVFKRQVIEN